jgi:hypothetical protein
MTALFSKTIDRIEEANQRLDVAMPNSTIQNKADALGRTIKDQFAPFVTFNKWLDDNGHGKWYAQLGTFLAKLPARAVRNIVVLLYKILESAAYAGVHPLKALHKLAKLVVQLTAELSKPETWSRIGIGMIGASLGCAAIPGNPLSVLGIGLGGALVVAGISAGALKAALCADRGFRRCAAKENVLGQLKQMPESMLTGFCMGLLFGAIQKAVTERTAAATVKPLTPQDAEQYANSLVKQYNLPQYSEVTLDPSGKITIEWTGKEACDSFIKMNPSISTCTPPAHTLDTIRMDILPNSSSVNLYFDDHWLCERFSDFPVRTVPVDTIGIHGSLPTPGSMPCPNFSNAAAVSAGLMASKNQKLK